MFKSCSILQPLIWQNKSLSPIDERLLDDQWASVPPPRGGGLGQTEAGVLASRCSWLQRRGRAGFAPDLLSIQVIACATTPLVPHIQLLKINYGTAETSVINKNQWYFSLATRETIVKGNLRKYYFEDLQESIIRYSSFCICSRWVKAGI